MTELARWFVKHGKHMTASDMRPIVHKHFPDRDQATAFYEYLSSPDGHRHFKRLLKRRLRR